jgi:hypothetical protein
MCLCSTCVVRCHQTVVVTLLVIHQDLSAVKEVAAHLNTNSSSLLSNCLSNIFIHILPLNAASRDPVAAAAVRRQINSAAACHDLLVQQLSKEVS